MSIYEDCNTVTESPSSGFLSSDLKSCHSCGRKFNPKSLERHEKICEKSNKTIRRTPFNSYLQRAKEIGTVLPEQKEQKKSAKCGQVTPKVLNNGPQKTPSPGSEQCPSCERFFSAKSAERHIVWCREQKSRLPKTPPDTVALQRLKARTKYRAPLPIKKSPDSQRLVRSADTVRESHSSGPRIEKSLSSSASNNNIPSKSNDLDPKTKKVVKFKEIFPVDNRDRNKNLDMLAALKLHLSELSTSDEFLDNFVLSTPLPRSRFCYNCGTRYPVPQAKFCCECGVQRMHPPPL